MGLRGTGDRVHRVFVIDDFPVVRCGLVDLIDVEPDLKTCGQAGDAVSALAGIEATRPDVAVVDLSLGPGENGLELVKMLRERYPRMCVVVLSMMDESVYAARSLRAGARGFIRKDTHPSTIIGQIRATLAGEIAVSERAARGIVEAVVGGGKAPVSLQGLTDRQLEVFRLIGQGLGTREIAEQLHVSMKTVESHRERIKAKLVLADGQALLRAAIAWTQSSNG